MDSREFSKSEYQGLRILILILICSLAYLLLGHLTSAWLLAAKIATQCGQMANIKAQSGSLSWADGKCKTFCYSKNWHSPYTHGFIPSSKLPSEELDHSIISVVDAIKKKKKKLD